MTCLVPDANFTMGNMFYCIGELAFGDIELAAIVFFIAVAFVMWKANIPIQAALPFSVILLFVLGSITYGITQTFTSLLLLLIVGVAVTFAMSLIHFARRT